MPTWWVQDTWICLQLLQQGESHGTRPSLIKSTKFRAKPILASKGMIVLVASENSQDLESVSFIIPTFAVDILLSSKRIPCYINAYLACSRNSLYSQAFIAEEEKHLTNRSLMFVWLFSMQIKCENKLYSY